MTKNQDHLITLLFVKYGSWQAVVDEWLTLDNNLSADEFEAVGAWLATEQKDTPMNATAHTEDGARYVTVEFPLDDPD